MTLSATERQRRSRAHRRGEHSLCDPIRCRDAGTEPAGAPVTTMVTRDAVTPAPDLGRRGTRLWSQLAPLLGPADLVLLEEGCRIADRLDRMDDLLRGREDAWFRFYSKADDGTVVRVVVDRALAEARQQADTLRGIVADLTRKAGVKPAEPEREASGSDDLAKRREDRRRAAGL